MFNNIIFNRTFSVYYYYRTFNTISIFKKKLTSKSGCLTYSFKSSISINLPTYSNYFIYTIRIKTKWVRISGSNSFYRMNISYTFIYYNRYCFTRMSYICTSCIFSFYIRFPWIFFPNIFLWSTVFFPITKPIFKCFSSYLSILMFI